MSFTKVFYFVGPLQAKLLGHVKTLCFAIVFFSIDKLID
jgi:hypothetical protein